VFTLAYPLVVMLLSGVVTYGLLGRVSTPPSRIGVIALMAAVAATALISLIVWRKLAEPAEQRCPLEGATFYVYLGLYLATSAFSGVVLAAAAADVRRQGGVLVWHVPAGILAVVLAYVVLVELVYLGLTCSS
jgi:hypothetical protein